MCRTALQIIQYRDFDSRNDGQIRDAIKRSNLVINLIGIDKETMNWSFEETHIDVAQRIAKAASENDMLERYWHVSCLGATEDATSRRLRTKVATGAAHGSSWSIWQPRASLACQRLLLQA